jgi:YesN/AraC family two-component response regulator
MFKLLIAEDEPLERMALRKIVNREFYNIDVIEDAKNGSEAIEKTKTYRPDIILMDIRMPETNGIEAQKKIIQFHPNVKSIILTAYSDFNYAQEAIKYGVADYLLKPAKPEDIKRAINKVIELIQMNPSLNGHAHQENIEKCDQPILQNAIRFIEKNFTKELKLKEIADLIHLNPQYFSRFFKKETGLTFTEYITKLRIGKAKRLLTDTDMPIYRVASEVGFSDAAYFSKVFLKYEHQSPFSYKKGKKIRT